MCLLKSIFDLKTYEMLGQGYVYTGAHQSSQMVRGTGSLAGELCHRRELCRDWPGRLWLPVVPCPALPNEPLRRREPEDEIHS
jgi:hypothetical protein